LAWFFIGFVSGLQLLQLTMFLKLWCCASMPSCLTKYLGELIITCSLLYGTVVLYLKEADCTFFRWLLVTTSIHFSCSLGDTSNLQVLSQKAKVGRHAQSILAFAFVLIIFSSLLFQKMLYIPWFMPALFYTCSSTLPTINIVRNCFTTWFGLKDTNKWKWEKGV
jgi:hypothetical protein